MTEMSQEVESELAFLSSCYSFKPGDLNFGEIRESSPSFPFLLDYGFCGGRRFF